MSTTPNEHTRNEKRRRFLRALIIALLIAIAAEFLLANRERLFVYSPELYPEIDPMPYTVNDPLMHEGDFIIANGDILAFEAVPGGLFSVSFDILYADTERTGTLPAPTVTVTTLDPRTSWQSDGFITVSTEQIAVGEAGKATSVTLYASTVREGTGDLCITFSGFTGDARVRNLTLNTPPAWHFSPVRMLLLALVLLLPYLLSASGLRSTVYDPQNPRHRYGVRTAVLFTVLLSLLFAAVFIPKSDRIAYPLTSDVRYHQPYIQQFDAFMKGQLHLDVPVSDEMLSLENPYDYDTRADAAPLWDRAYYDGKYYSYFGIAPVLLVYMPFYLLTGGLPTDAFVMTLFLLISAVFIPLTVFKWADLHERKTLPLSLLWGGGVTALLCSMVLLIARSVTPFYYIATASANAFLALFLFLLMKAVEQKHLRDRCIFYVLAGLAYGAMLHSRLNIALLAAFIVIPFLIFRVLKKQTDSGAESDSTPDPIAQESGKLRLLLSHVRTNLAHPKEILFSLLSLGLPVAIALGGALLLNLLRFDSLFEFGTSYQLTVSDIRYNTLSLGNLFPALWHYFFFPLAESTQFPYVALQRLSMNDYGHYVYIDAGLGLFSLPLFTALLLSPAVRFMKKRTLYEKLLLAFLLIGLVTLALLNFSLGGAIFRYTADLTVLGAIGAVCLLLALYTTVAGTDDVREEERLAVIASDSREKLAYTALVIFFLISVAVTLLLTLSANGNLSKYSANVFVAIINFLSFR